MTGYPKQQAMVNCLMGGAIGDACGNDIEFSSIEEIRNEYGEEGLKNLTTPHITDDTQMTLFTAEGILNWHYQKEQSDEALLDCIYQGYLRWLHTQDSETFSFLNTGFLLRQQGLYVERAPGVTCLNALRSGKMGTTQEKLNDSKGCGGIMRIAPIGLYFSHDPEKAFRVAADAAAITHSHPSGYLSSGFFAALLAQLVTELDRPEGASLVQTTLSLLPLLKSYTDHEETLIALDNMLNIHHSSKNITPELLESMGQGWPGAVGEEALAMGLLCALRFSDFKTGVLASANHSGDSDSTATLTGQLLGLRNDLPTDWCEYISTSPGLGVLVKEVGEDLSKAIHYRNVPVEERRILDEYKRYH